MHTALDSRAVPESLNATRATRRHQVFNLPVSVPVHDTRAPAWSVVHKIYGSFQGLARLSHDAVTNLQIETNRLLTKVYITLHRKHEINKSECCHFAVRPTGSKRTQRARLFLSGKGIPSTHSSSGLLAPKSTFILRSRVQEYSVFRISALFRWKLVKTNS